MALDLEMAAVSADATATAETTVVVALGEEEIGADGADQQPTQPNPRQPPYQQLTSMESLEADLAEAQAEPDLEAAAAAAALGDKEKSPASTTATADGGECERWLQRLERLARVYLGKFGGIEGKKKPARPALYQFFASGFISFAGILVISATDYWYLTRTFKTGEHTAVMMLIGSFAATAVLVYDLYASPYSQPRNVLGGHVISAFLGVSVRLACNKLAIDTWIQAPLAVAISIFFMNVFEVVHPPGGASAMIAVIGGPAVFNLGYGFILTCLGGAVISVIVACLGNNLIPGRQYPSYWVH